MRVDVIKHYVVKIGQLDGARNLTLPYYMTDQDRPLPNVQLPSM